MEFKYDGVGLGKGGDVTLCYDGKPNPRSTLTVGSDFASSSPRVNHRPRRTIKLGDRFCQGVMFVPDLLCTAAD